VTPNIFPWWVTLYSLLLFPKVADDGSSRA
jgi:hypothetical protein